MNKISIRPLLDNDFPQWLPLWDANNMDRPNEPVTSQTWARLLDPDYPIHGLCAVQDDKILGFVHYVVHPTTGSIEPICYMQDVYVDPSMRRKGIARALVQEVAEIKSRENWARIYWLAEGNNEAAQELYKDIGVKLNFTLHVLI